MVWRNTIFQFTVEQPEVLYIPDQPKFFIIFVCNIFYKKSMRVRKEIRKLIFALLPMWADYLKCCSCKHPKPTTQAVCCPMKTMNDSAKRERSKKNSVCPKDRVSVQYVEGSSMAKMTYSLSDGLKILVPRPTAAAAVALQNPQQQQIADMSSRSVSGRFNNTSHRVMRASAMWIVVILQLSLFIFILNILFINEPW